MIGHHDSRPSIHVSQPYPLHLLWEFQQEQLFTDIDVVCGTLRTGCHRYAAMFYLLLDAEDHKRLAKVDICER
jgi:hypothetical protein